MAEKKKLIITTSGDRPLSAIRKDLTEKGFTVDHVLKEIGVITGTSSSTVEKLLAIPGIADVSPDEPVDIGPPDAPVM